VRPWGAVLVELQPNAVGDGFADNHWHRRYPRAEPRRQMIDKARVGAALGKKAAAGAQALANNPRGCSALSAASTLAFRGVIHTKVNAVVLFYFIDKKIFQNVLPACWGERFFADSAMN
jgi:hypothetical protein